MQSRYYDSNTCRFINADGYVSTGRGILGYNMFAYCGNNPVMRVDPNGEGWILVVAILAIVVFSLTSCSQQPTQEQIEKAQNDAKEKYNENTVSINNSLENAAVNVTINDTGDVIKIQNSYQISNKYEQEAILNVIVNSEEYKGNHTDIEKMTIEWSAHNLGFSLTSNEKINNLASSALKKDDAHISSQSVDIGQSDKLHWLYYIVTLGGKISW